MTQVVYHESGSFSKWRQAQQIARRVLKSSGRVQLRGYSQITVNIPNSVMRRDKD